MSDFLALQRRRVPLMITQDVIDHVPCTRLFTSDVDFNTHIQYLHKYLLHTSKRRNNSGEVGLLVNTLDWSTHLILGDSLAIRMETNPRAAYLMRNGCSRSLLFLHNHPDNSCFSEQDLKTFITQDSLYLMTAIGNNGNIHVLAKGDRFSKEAVVFEHNKYKDINGGVSHVLRESTRLGLLYKFGRCSK